MELTSSEFSSEAAHIKELSEENDKLRIQINELRQPSEVDGGGGGGGCGPKGRGIRKSDSTGSIVPPQTVVSEECRERTHSLVYSNAIKLNIAVFSHTLLTACLPLFPACLFLQ